MCTRLVLDLTEMCPKPHLAGFSHSYPAGARCGFRENLFWNQRTMSQMKQMALTMLSAALKRQYSSLNTVLPLCLPVLTKFVERQWI